MNFRYIQRLLKQIYTLICTLILLAIIIEKLEAHPITITLDQQPTKTCLIMSSENVMFQKNPEAFLPPERNNPLSYFYARTPRNTGNNPLLRNDPLYPLAEVLMSEKKITSLNPVDAPHLTTVFQKQTLDRIKMVTTNLVSFKGGPRFGEEGAVFLGFGLETRFTIKNGPYVFVKCKSLSRVWPFQRYTVMTADIIRIQLVNYKIAEEQLVGQAEYFYQLPEPTLFKINIKNIHTQTSNAKSERPNKRSSFAALLGGACGALAGQVIATTQHLECCRVESPFSDGGMAINNLTTWCCTTLGIAAGASLGYALERGINFVNRGHATTHTVKQSIKKGNASAINPPDGPSESTVTLQPTSTTGLRQRKQ